MSLYESFTTFVECCYFYNALGSPSVLTGRMVCSRKSRLPGIDEIRLRALSPHAHTRCRFFARANECRFVNAATFSRPEKLYLGATFQSSLPRNILETGKNERKTNRKERRQDGQSALEKNGWLVNLIVLAFIAPPGIFLLGEML